MPLVGILVALTAGMPAAKLAAIIEAGMGKTLEHIAPIIPLGAMIGRMIEESGDLPAAANCRLCDYCPSLAIGLVTSGALREPLRDKQDS